LHRSVGPQAKAFHHPWPKTFNQYVGTAREITRTFTSFLRLEVQLQQGPTALDKVSRIADLSLRTINGHDVGSHIGQQHAGEGYRA